jgi:hypothetical protein
MRSRISSTLKPAGYMTLAIALMVAVMVQPGFAKEKKQVIERFQADSMDLDSGRAEIAEIGIMEWSTDEERQALIQAFKDGGNQGAYKYLNKQDEKAYVSFPNTLGYQMRYAFQFHSDGKRQMVMATNRPIGMGEVMRDTDSQRDSISLVTLELDPSTNEGTGEMVFGAEFKVNQKTGQLDIETMSMNPTKLTNVKPQKVKHKK